MDNNKFTFNTVDFSKLTDINNENDKLEIQSKDIIKDIYLELEDDICSDSEEELNLEEKVFKFVDNNIDDILKNSKLKDNLSPAKNHYIKKLIDQDDYDEKTAIKFSLYLLLMMYILIGRD